MSAQLDLAGHAQLGPEAASRRDPVVGCRQGQEEGGLLVRAVVYLLDPEAASRRDPVVVYLLDLAVVSQQALAVDVQLDLVAASRLVLAVDVPQVQARILILGIGLIPTVESGAARALVMYSDYWPKSVCLRFQA